MGRQIFWFLSIVQSPGRTSFPLAGYFLTPHLYHHASYTNIDATVTDSQRTAVFTAIANIESSLTFLINLTAQERQSLPKMGSSSQAFVSKALEIAANNPQFIPPYADIPAMQKDYDLALRLQGIEMQLASLHEKVSDTNLAAGSEAYITGLTIYNSLKAAAKVSVPGAKALATELAERFAQDSATPATPTPTPM